jgi:hypothetical protein
MINKLVLKGKINYVCTTCSETFTRKASGQRHNSNLHFGTASVVRLFDYVIGRSSGQYLPSDPRDFTLTKKQEKIDHEAEKILGDLNDYSFLQRMVNAKQKNLGTPGEGIPFLLDLDKTSKRAASSENALNDYQIARSELAMIEQMLTHYYSKQFAHDTIRTLINMSNVKGNYSAIHDALERHRKNIQNRFGWI